MKFWHNTKIGMIVVGVLTVSAWGQRSALTESKGLRECASCHYQWIETFDKHNAILLIEKPSEPMEASSQVCLGCHDGSIVDSRRRVWQEHGHKKGIVPPVDMIIPEGLPLKEGKIACRTCHTAHIGDGPVDLENPVFLRVANDESQLCKLCHSDKIPSENSHKTHPLGQLSEPIPEALIQSGAKAKPDQRQVQCQVCHIAHGSKQDHLLVMGADNNNLCLTCHSGQRPGMWHEKQPGAHPDRPIIETQVQFEAIHNMGTRLGVDNRLICLSCHRMHDGKSGRFMLARSLEDSIFCLQCHPEQEKFLTSIHDPRRFASDKKNHQGLTIEEGGPCSTCHMFHKLAQEPADPNSDPHNMCQTCHRSNGLAHQADIKRGNLAYSHPLGIMTGPIHGDLELPLLTEKVNGSNQNRIACLTCHSLHYSDRENCLRASPEALCDACHSELSNRMTGNVHDFRAMGQRKSAQVKSNIDCRICHKQIHSKEDIEHVGKCGLCHKMHSWHENDGLWTFTTPDLNGSSNKGVCESCHDNVSWISPGQQEPQPGMVMHPREISSNEFHGQKNKYIECQTCHDPHANSEVPGLLKNKDGSSPEDICYECHLDQKCLETSMHSRMAMIQQDVSRPCSPCHSSHVREDSSLDKLWSMPLSGQGQDDSEKRCMSCHGDKGSAKSIRMFVHPEPFLMQGATQMWSRSIEAEFADSADNRVTCLTCHLPHGNCFSGKYNLDDSDTIPPAHIQALKPMLRPDVAQELCAQCHGFDSLSLYLFYHEPSKRR